MVASQSENLTRNQDLELGSHGRFTWAQIWWRGMIWSNEGCGKVSTHLDMPRIYLLHKVPSWTETLENCWKIFTRQMSMKICTSQWYMQEKVSKMFGVIQAKINSTFFAKCHLGQNRKRIIGGWFMNMAMKHFAIFEQDRTQKIYENYLGIFRMTEI